MTWIDAFNELTKKQEAFVMVTIAEVRGHAPRLAGSKMLVSSQEIFGSVGGGNLEQVAIKCSRKMLQGKNKATQILTVTLNPTSGEHGVQCCGGEVTLLLETINPERSTVAIFGAGHVGQALIKVLSILPIDIVVTDSRPEQLKQAQEFSSSEAKLAFRLEKIPEIVIETLPQNSHILILTHDHAEDIAILDTALKHEGLGYIGLIGSSAKWSHFKQELAKQGHDKAAQARVTTPIGLPNIFGKTPQTIAISTAAQLLNYLDIETP